MRRNRWPGSAKISELRGAGVSRLDRDSEGGGSAMRCSRLTPVTWSPRWIVRTAAVRKVR